MKRLLLIILLALSSGPVYAEWVGISFTKSAGGYDVYANPDTIRRKGDLVKMWILYDYKTLQLATGLAHLSDLIQLEANCIEKLHRRLAYTWWSGNMGDGNVIFSHSGEGNWIPIQPGTVVTLCGHLPAARNDRALLELVGRIIEMGQRVVKGAH